MSVESLAQALLDAGVLDATSVQMRAPRARVGKSFLEEIIADGIVTESSLVNQLARALSVPRFDPKERQPEADALALLDLRSCEELSSVPVALRGGGALLWVAMCDPTDEGMANELARRTGRRIKACLIGPRELTRLLNQLAQSGGLPASAGQSQAAQGQFQTTAAASAQTYRQSVPMPPQQQPQMAQQMPMQMAQQATMMGMQPGMPMQGQMVQNPYGYGAPNSGYGTGFFSAPPGMGQMVPQQQAPSPYSMPPTAPPPAGAATTGGAGAAELAKLEDELNQARQVVKVLAQLLVERGLIDGNELKRRLRAERDKR